jgi:hypothetical protein
VDFLRGSFYKSAKIIVSDSRTIDESRIGKDSERSSSGSLTDVSDKYTESIIAVDDMLSKQLTRNKQKYSYSILP